MAGLLLCAKDMERRMAGRRNALGLGIMERRGDLLSSARARDISVTGVFLLGRVMGGPRRARLEIPVPGGLLMVEALQVRDGGTADGFGAAYRFLPMSLANRGRLSALLRELDEYAAS